MDEASQTILALKPVTFRYKDDSNPACRPEFGLIAEEVAKVDPDLVARDKEGKPYTVRYDQVNAMLLTSSSKNIAKCSDRKRQSRNCSSVPATNRKTLSPTWRNSKSKLKPWRRAFRE